MFVSSFLSVLIKSVYTLEISPIIQLLKSNIFLFQRVERYPVWGWYLSGDGCVVYYFSWQRIAVRTTRNKSRTKSEHSRCTLALRTRNIIHPPLFHIVSPTWCINQTSFHQHGHYSEREWRGGHEKFTERLKVRHKASSRAELGGVCIPDGERHNDDQDANADGSVVANKGIVFDWLQHRNYRV